MSNATIMDEYLKNFVSKTVNLKMSGIINYNIIINNFKFKCKGNKLIIGKLKDGIIITFDEVNNVEKDVANNITIKFNINEKIFLTLI